MTELEQLRKQVAYLKRVRDTAGEQLAAKDAEIKRLRAQLEDQARQSLALLQWTRA